MSLIDLSVMINPSTSLSQEGWWEYKILFSLVYLKSYQSQIQVALSLTKWNMICKSFRAQ